MSEFNVYRDGHKMRDEIAELRAELANVHHNAEMWYAEKLRAEAAIARVREVLTDHDDCTCQVRGHGCEHMWNEMREVFRPALDGNTE